MSRLWLIVFLIPLAACSPRSDQNDRPIDPVGASFLGQAQQAYTRGAFARAFAFTDSAEQYVPDLPQLAYLRGLLLTEFNRFDESDAAFERVLELDPDYRGVHFNIANNAFLRSSFSLENAFRDAIRHYRAEEALLRGYLREEREREGDREALAAVLLQIGQVYERLQVPDSARIAYRQVLELDAENANAHAWLAGLQQADGRFEEALVNAQRAVDLEENPEHRLLLGTLLVEQGRFESALPYLTEVARQQPWNRTAHYHLGRALQQMGREDEGAVYLARSDSLETLRSQIQMARMQTLQHPNDPVRWENYAFLLDRAGRGMEARKAFNVMQYLQAADPHAAAR